MKESQFQKKLINNIKTIFPDAIVMKLDPNYIQGIPDLVVFNGPNYALLEVKKGEFENRQPNQEYYISLFSNWSYASFVYPENMEEVLDELQRAL